MSVIAAVVLALVVGVLCILIGYSIRRAREEYTGIHDHVAELITANLELSRAIMTSCDMKLRDELEQRTKTAELQREIQIAQLNVQLERMRPQAEPLTKPSAVPFVQGIVNTVKPIK